MVDCIGILYRYKERSVPQDVFLQDRRAQTIASTKQFVSDFQYKDFIIMISQEIQSYLFSRSSKNYMHFDYPLFPNERKRLIKNLDNDIPHHRYLPFIRVNIIQPKYNRGLREQKKIPKKVRKIELPSHHDALIYQYFSYILNKEYNLAVNDSLIDEVAVAYRLDRHISNIDVAKEVIDFITLNEECWIIKGDFKHFFDNLDHQILESQLHKVLKSVYDEDIRQAIKSIENYRFVTKVKLEKQLKEANIRFPYTRNGKSSYLKNSKQLGELLKSNKIRLSAKSCKGIPQGTAVSAILANIYMYSFDSWLGNLIKEYHGLYRRYSDDFIVILPLSKNDYCKVKKIQGLILKNVYDNLRLKL